MAKKKPSGLSKRQPAKNKVQWALPLSKTNFIYFAAALATLVLGYALMATGIASDPQQHFERWASPLAIVIAPTVLVVAYCIAIPLAIMKREKVSDKTAE